jgi:hypothetical protein
MRGDTRREMADLMEAVRHLDCDLLLEHLSRHETNYRGSSGSWAKEAAEQVADLRRQVFGIERTRALLKAAQTRALVRCR